MSPVLKIFAGALMMVLGIFTSVTYSNQLLNLIQGGIGPLLVLVGAFIVWLESDEWKVQREEKKEKETQFNGQSTLEQQTSDDTTTQTSKSDMERETREAAKEIKQAVSSSEKSRKSSAEQVVKNRTVQEVKETLQDRQDITARQLLEAERNNQNRKTLVDYLERRIE